MGRTGTRALAGRAGRAHVRQPHGHPRTPAARRQRQTQYIRETGRTLAEATSKTLPPWSIAPSRTLSPRKAGHLPESYPYLTAEELSTSSGAWPQSWRPHGRAARGTSAPFGCAIQRLPSRPMPGASSWSGAPPAQTPVGTGDPGRQPPFFSDLRLVQACGGGVTSWSRSCRD